MLKKYNTVFQDLPYGLPLVHGQRDHIIEFILGSKVVRRKSYRKFHQHKIEIECLVQELLDYGTIKKQQDRVFNTDHTSKEKGWLL
jgi:hypothetical protein